MRVSEQNLRLIVRKIIQESFLNPDPDTLEVIRAGGHDMMQRLHNLSLKKDETVEKPPELVNVGDMINVLENYKPYYHDDPIWKKIIKKWTSPYPTDGYVKKFDQLNYHFELEDGTVKSFPEYIGRSTRPTMVLVRVEQ